MWGGSANSETNFPAVGINSPDHYLSVYGLWYASRSLLTNDRLGKVLGHQIKCTSSLKVLDLLLGKRMRNLHLPWLTR